jgi:integrase
LTQVSTSEREALLSDLNKRRDWALRFSALAETMPGPNLTKSAATTPCNPETALHFCAGLPKSVQPDIWDGYRAALFSALHLGSPFMPRAVRDSKLDSAEARAKLAPRDKPYYRDLDEGLHLGYRRNKTGGKWVVRWYAGEGAYKLETLPGMADDHMRADGAIVLNFRQAQDEARRRFVKYKRVAKGLPAELGPYTVKMAVDEYIAFLEQNRKSGRDARYRADALILPRLGDIAAAALTAERIGAWMRQLALEPARVRSQHGKAQRYKPLDEEDEEAVRRRKVSANRCFSVLKAALNMAWRAKKIATDDEWRRVELFGEADAARVRFLSIDECRRLINASEGDFRDLVRAALATGCRYGELGRLEARDFHPDSGTLHIRVSKTAQSRHVVLNDEGIALFKRLAAGRADRELLLRKPDGDRWGKSNQARPLILASARAKIEPAINFHALRHTWASHAVMAGAPLLVVAKNLGHSDTRMVEHHYGHLSKGYMADAIRAAAPRFDIAEDSTVTPLAGGR